MQTLFDAEERKTILRRLDSVQPSSARQWGKMNAAQMMAHCSSALEMATGDQPRPQKLIGKLLGPFFKKALLGEQPFSKDSPTDPAYVITGERDFAKEKERLVALVSKFAERGPGKVDGSIHSFLGRLKGDEWGLMMQKHLDHHLRQFGA